MTASEPEPEPETKPEVDTIDLTGEEASEFTGAAGAIPRPGKVKSVRADDITARAQGREVCMAPFRRGLPETRRVLRLPQHGSAQPRQLVHAEA